MLAVRRCVAARTARAILAIATGLAVHGAAALADSPGAPAYFGIQPGTTIRAQVDLALGEPVRRVSPGALVYEYHPARGDADSSRVVIAFDDDTLAVARVDAYLARPFAADAARAQFGTRILARDREDGGREELYYPQLQALVFGSRQPDAPVAAVGFVSPRSIGRAFASRAMERLSANAADQDARTEADKAVLVDPDGGAGYLAQGRCLLAAGNTDEAVVRFTAAASARHGKADRYAAHVWLARVAAEHRKAPDRAEAEWQLALAEAPASRRGEALRLHAAFLRAQKRNDDAARQLTAALQADPADVAAVRALVDLYWDTDQFAKALPHVEALARRTEADRDKAHATDLFRYAYCLNETGRGAEGLRAYDAFLALHGPSAGAFNNIGVILLRRGSPELAIGRFREGLAMEAGHQTLKLNLTRALLDARQYQEALGHAQASAAAHPQNASMKFEVARCYGALRKKKDALRWARDAVAAGFADRRALNTDKYLEDLRDHEEYQALLARAR